MSENPRPSRNEADARGRGVRGGAVGEAAEDEHDTQGHVFRFGAATPDSEDDEDVTGHVQPPRDVDGLSPHPPIA